MADYWIFFVPPLAGALIGYFTNDLAINMLFRPYRAYYIGKTRIPFTPGLIPYNQERLARRVSDTIMSSLLTPEELHRLAQRLLKTERMQAAILWLLQLALDQVRQDEQQKTAKILAKILRDLFGESLPRLLRVFARRDSFLKEQLNQIFDQVLLDFQLSDTQARQFANWLLEVVLPPNALRLAIINFLSDRNIQVIDEGFREKTTGTYWVFANLFGIRNALLRLRAFCLEEKELTNTRLQELILSLEVRNRLRHWLQNLGLQNLPKSTLQQLRKTTREAARGYVRERGADFLQEFNETIDWEKFAAVIVNRLQSSPAITQSLDLVSQELALILERYLEKDLEKLVSQAIPILAIDEVIIERVMATSPQQLESAVQGIVKSELRAIVNLGGILGLVIGLLQSAILWFR